MQLSAILLAALVVSTAIAQRPARSRPGPEAALAQKLESSFLRHADWSTDFDEALELARTEQKLVFAYFTTAYY